MGRMILAVGVACVAGAATFLACVSDNDAPNIFTGSDASASDSSIADGQTLFDAGPQPGLDVTQPPVDAGPDATPPSVLTNDAGLLAVWLEGASKNYQSDGGFGVWTDWSGNHNDATGDTPPIVYPAGVNGHDAIDFNQGDVTLDITDNATVEFGVDDMLIAVVARQLSNQAPCNIWAKSAYGPSGGVPNYKSGLELFTVVAETDAGTKFADLTTRIDATTTFDWGSSIFDNTFHRIALRRSGGAGTLTLYVDSNSPRPTSVSSFSSLNEATYDVVLGGKPAQESFNGTVDVQIAELIALHAPNSVVTDQDVSDVMTYFSAKYALP